VEELWHERCLTRHVVFPEPDPIDDAPPDTRVHRFTVNRGMKVAIVIETRDWYSGLLQAAVAQARIDGVN
jgi:hypothetical protein